MKYKIMLISTMILFGVGANALGQVRINEIRSNDASTDDIEFVELLGLSGTDLTGYKLYHVNGNGDDEIFTFTIGSFTIPDDGITDNGSNALGFYVLGTGGNSSGVDETESGSLQGGPDGLILYNSSNEIIDAVAWGGAGDISTDITTTGSPSADNYLHVTTSDGNDDNSLQAPNDVLNDDGSGWTYAAATPGAINDTQTSGSIILASSVKAQPANHATSFSGTGVINSVDLTWADASGVPLPDAYLVIVSDVDYGSITDPTDSTPESNDADLSDGIGVRNVAYGTEAISFSGLEELTTYYFKIYPYTNTGSDIDYKTDGTVPQASATTLDTPDIVLNEILADPASGADPNGDGSPDTSDDEFLEFVNTGSTNLDISDWTIEDGGGKTHTFTNPTVLKPFQGIVVFGGGAPAGNFGGSLTQTAGGLSLNNGGDDVILKNDSGIEIISYTYGGEGGDNQSLTRSPELTGNFVKHETVSESSYSPGTRANGATFQPSAKIAGSEGWRMLSTPTTGSSYADLLGPFWTQGITGSDAPSNGEPNVETYNGSAFAGISDMAATMTPGKGFITYVYADDDYDGTPDAFPKTLELFAVPNSGSYSPTLTSGAEKWTLVGNPYYSGIDWDELNKTDLMGTVYVYVYDHSYGTPTGGDVEASGSAGSYRVWNGYTGSLNDGRISSFQGFWVQNAASGTPSLTIEEADKIATDTTLFKQGKASNSISIKLCGSMGNMMSETFLSFTQGGKTGKDNFDGLKLKPVDFKNYLNVATLAEQTQLAINNLPNDFAREVEIPLAVQAFSANSEQHTWENVGGTVMLSWPVLENIPNDWTLTLHDFLTGTSVDMKNLDSYTFTLEGEETAQKINPTTTVLLPQPPTVEKILKKGTNPRFTLTVTKGKTSSTEPNSIPEHFALEQNYPNPFNPTTNIQYSVAKSGPVLLTIYNVMGQQVATLIDGAKSPGTYRISWDASKMASGIYYYRLQAGNEVLTRQMTLIK